MFLKHGETILLETHQGSQFIHVKSGKGVAKTCEKSLLSDETTVTIPLHTPQDSIHSNSTLFTHHPNILSVPVNDECNHTKLRVGGIPANLFLMAFSISVISSLGMWR